MLHVLAEVHAAKVLASCESRNAHFGDRLRNDDGSQILIMRKGSVIQGGHAQAVDIHRHDHVIVLLHLLTQQ